MKNCKCLKIVVYFFSLLIITQGCAGLPRGYITETERYRSHQPYNSVAIADLEVEELVIQSDVSEAARRLKSLDTAEAAMITPLCAGVLAAGSVLPIAYIPGILCLGTAASIATQSTEEDLPRERKEAKTFVGEQLGKNLDGLNHDLKEALAKYAQESGIENVNLGNTAESTQGDLIVKIGASRIAFDKHTERAGGPYSFLLTVRAELLEGALGRRLDALEYTFKAGLFPLEKWMADDFTLLREAVEAGYKEIAANIIDDFLLIWHPPLPRDTAGHIPHYVLKSLSQPIKIGLSTREPHYGVATQKSFDVGTLQPKLEWEAFPRVEDIDGIRFMPDYVTDVRYDLRVYRGVVTGHVTLPQKYYPVYSRSGLVEPFHKLEEPLEFCKQYFWTVRARFNYKGLPKMTEWSGAYHTGGNRAKPWSVRRDMKSGIIWNWPARGLYFLIHTPNAPWSGKCKSYR